MNPHAQNLLKKLNSLTLTTRERLEIRGDLHVFMHEHPARIPTRRIVARELRSFIASLSATRFAGASFAVFALVILGASTSYAAEHSLPGDLLYAVKINIDEPLAGALAVSDSARAAWQVELADRRLAEAEALAAQGKLTPAVSAAAAQQITQTTERVSVAVSHSSKNPGSVASIAATQAQLETSLSAHAQALTALTAVIPASQNQIAPILSTVESSAHTVTTASAQAAGALAAADIKTALQTAGTNTVQASSTTSVTNVANQIATTSSSTIHTLKK